MPTDLHLRPTHRDDLDFVLALERDDENSPFVGRWSRDEHAAAIDAPDREHWIIETGRPSRSAGFIIGLDLGCADRGVHVKRMVVAEKGRGIGRAAIEQFCRHAFSTQRPPYVWLDVLAGNHRARAAYRAAGFEERAFPDDAVAEWARLVGGFDDDSRLMFRAAPGGDDLPGAPAPKTVAMDCPDALAWTDSDDVPDEVARAVDEGLDGANLAAAPLSDVHPLACSVRAADGTIIGGAVGRTWGACAELRQIWVDAAQRRSGIGARLLERFERAAAARGCRTVHLETFSFQAPSLYRRAGYADRTRFTGFPDGIVKHVMAKSIGAAPAIVLREVRDDDLETLFEHECDDVARHMAAFVRRDPDDRDAYLARWRRLRADATIVARAIEVDGRLAGSVVLYVGEGCPEVTYWIGRGFWGRGIATAALREFLALCPERPIHARAARDNLGSRRVLEKCGFRVVGEEPSHAEARGATIDQYLFRLRGPSRGEAR